jgi:hypothetical protein
VLIRDHPPAYISFEQFLSDQERLRGNAQMRHCGQADEGGPAREGPAMLQGLVVCGHCGRKMYLSYGAPPSAGVSVSLLKRPSAAGRNGLSGPRRQAH